MTDPEDPAAKNEQELNLFSDQPFPEEAPAEPENDAYVLQPDDFGQDLPETDNAGPAAPPETPFPGDSDAVSAEPERSVAASDTDDSPVVAPPPPPRKQPAPMRPGIVVAPRAVRPAAPASSSAQAAASAQKFKPLPHALQGDQPLGQMLSSIRSARGMSLEEVAAFTRIRMEYLLELEAGELLHKLPSVYISGYVRKLIEVYELSPEDSDILLKRMRKETPLDPEELPKTLLETVNENTLVNEGETKRIRYVTIIFYAVIGLVSVAVLWLLILAIVHYAGNSEPVPGRDPATSDPGMVQPAEEPVSQTVHMDESELDALIVPETPSISVLKMSKVPGVRESL